MTRIEIKIPKTPDIKSPTFTAEQMREIGEFSVQVLKERVAGQVDVLDQPAKSLQPKYAKAKAKKGLPAVRDLRVTGNMLGSTQVLKSDANHALVGIRGTTPFRKALFNQNIDPWFGLSGHDDQRLLDEKVRPLFAQNIEDALK